MLGGDLYLLVVILQINWNISINASLIFPYLYSPAPPTVVVEVLLPGVAAAIISISSMTD